VHGGGAEDRPFGNGQLDGVEDERLRLRPSEPAVEGDELLEGAALVELRVVEAPDHDVGDVLEAVCAEEMVRGVRRERGERILADDTPVGQVAGALRAQRNRAVTIQFTANNILNFVNYTRVDTVVNSPTFGQVLGVSGMRTMQLNLRFRY